MWFTVLYSILALGVDFVIFYFTKAYEYAYLWFIPFVAFPILYVVIFALSLVILFLVSLLIKTNKEIEKPNKVARFFVSQIVRQLNMLSGIICKRTGFLKIPHNEPYLIIYNHTSNYDPMLIMDYLRRDRIICVTKPSNIKIPIAGPFIYRAGYIPINREDAKEGTKAIMKAVDMMKNNYGSIAIAPEGKRMKDGHLGDFHPGSLQIAYHAHAPIVVCCFKGAVNIHKNFLKKFTKVNMDILEVFDYESYKDISSVELTRKITNMYREALGEPLEEAPVEEVKE